MVAEMPQFEIVWPQCVARAWEDVKFREELKRNPVSTLREVFQFIIPAGIDLKVVESDEVLETQDANTLKMVIPPVPDVDMREIALVGPEGNKKERRFTFSLSATFC
jgi:ribosomally synthesized peptide (two-chain TOMM family)